ncbi:DUF4249 domain-containing protein [Ilyomonas limi]|uniref:DUF4249 domain-containing protein n=1 Tax=Ilyomonas limi TaxID=2575867 RepID=A0A4U3L0E8_9BACT|nr:DUF4249 domain-containing protein [Ilyomonas limi]TKK66907.1 DUF4249 domain-containing protein [Ilyomonas limi]
MMKKIYIPIIAVLLFFACKEVFNPPVTSAVTGYLVVEGFINSGNGASTIKLTRTTKLVDSAATIYEHNAQVKIEDESNATYPLYERDSGNYVSDNLFLNPALKYRIHITTTNGDEYISDFTAVKQTPPIDSISWKVENGGVQIYVNAHDATNTTRYYQHKYSETWEFQSPFIKRITYVIDPVSSKIIGVTELPNADTSIFKCWRTQTPSNILLTSTEKLSEDKVFLPIRYIEPKGGELSILYYIEVRQYALSHEAYLFKQKLKKNTEQLGTIFDPQPSELGGNVHCITNPSQQVVGFVDVTQEQVAKLFINNKELTNWPQTIPCSEEVVENKPENYDPFLMPTHVYEYIGRNSIKSYYVADPICVDCTLRGTNVKPLFWP